MLHRSRRIKFGEWLLDHRWWIVALAGVSVLAFEFIEHNPLEQQLVVSAYVELVFFGILMPVFTGMLLTGLAIRSNLAWKNYYQNLSSNLAIQLQEVHADDELANIILQFFSVIMPLRGAVVYKFYPDTRKYNPVLCRMFTKDASLTASELKCWGTGCFLLHYAARNEEVIRQCLDHDVSTSSTSSNCFCVPFKFSNEVVAGIRLFIKKGSDPTQEQVSLLKEITPVIATAFHHIQLEDSMKKRDDLLVAESKRLGRDVHDSLGHSLAYLRLRLDQISMESSQSGLENLYREVSSLRDVAKDAYDQMRAILASLTPQGDPDISRTLVNFADKIGQRENVLVTTHITGQPYPLTPLVERNIFFIFQEIMTNIEKHAGARKINVNLDWRENDLVIKVNDDGIGFNPETPVQNGHFGLNNMRERAQESNAQLVIASQPNQGTCISLYIPYEDGK